MKYNEEWENKKNTCLFLLTLLSLTLLNPLAWVWIAALAIHLVNETNKYTLHKFTCSSLWGTWWNELQKKDCTRKPCFYFEKKTKAIIWWDVQFPIFFLLVLNSVVLFCVTWLPEEIFAISATSTKREFFCCRILSGYRVGMIN